MSRGPAPSDPTGPRGGSKGGADPNRGAPPPDQTGPRGGSPGGPAPTRAPDTSSDPNGLPPLPPDKPQPKQDPFNMPTTALIETRAPSRGLRPGPNVDIAGFHLNMPVADMGQRQSVTDLMQSLFQMSEPDLKALQQRLVEANYLDPKDSTTGLSNTTGFMDSRTTAAYEKLLIDAYGYQQSNPGKDMTVDDLLNEKIAAYQAGGGNKTTTSQINLFNPLQAQSFLMGAASKLLGRDPNPGELAGFVSALNSYQQQNPDLSTVTISPDGTKQTVADKAGITSLHGGDAAAQNYLLNDQGGDVAQHSQNVAMQSLLSTLGVGALPGMSG